MADWTDHAREALQNGPAALVTILATEGSAPRGPGARMVVTASGLSGSIGGGALEHQAMRQARAILTHPPGSWRVQDYPLGPLLGQCCGGRVRLRVERLADVPEGAGIEEAAILPVLMFGAGHVGSAIATRTTGLPVDLAWYDSRPEVCAATQAALADEPALLDRAASAGADTAVLILTHDHGLDYRLTAAALGSPARFVGLIGSRTKRARFRSRLEKDGVDPARLTCPIGLPGIVGKEPEVIAIATLAQLLTLRNRS